MSSAGIPIILKEANVVQTQPNVLRLSFAQSLTLSANSEIALLKCIIPYSWFNMTTAYNNRTVSYYWPTDDSTNVVTFPEGYFLISDISNYIQQIMLANGHYLVDDNGANVFYFQIQPNYTIYGATCTFTVLPSSLPTGWSNPASLDLSVPNARTPQLIFGSNNFNLLIGFNKSTSYPTTPQTSTTLINSPNIPKASPTSSVMIACNMVSAPSYNTYGNIIDIFTPEVLFGQQCVIQPPQLIWYKCMGGLYPSIDITFYDQDLVPLAIKDTQITVSVMIRQAPRLGNN